MKLIIIGYELSAKRPTFFFYLTPISVVKNRSDKMDHQPITFLSSKFVQRKDYKAYLLNLNLEYYLNEFCYVNENNHVVIDYSVFNGRIKKVDEELGNLLINVLATKFYESLKREEQMVVHVNLDTFQLLHLERHYSFFYKMSCRFQTEFPMAMKQCYVYNVPLLFSQLLTCIVAFVDKDTQRKMVQVS